MNKVNEKISNEMRQKMNDNDKKSCEVGINKDTILQSKNNNNGDLNEKSLESHISNDQTMNTEESEDNLIPTNSVIHTVQEEVEKTNAKCNMESSIKEQTIEFSQLVYWRDPFPEITPLKQETSTDETKPDLPIEVKIKDISIENLVSNTSLPSKVETLPKVEEANKKDDAFIKISLDSVWLEKYKYDDAETKYYQKLAKQDEYEVKLNVVTKPQNNVKHTSELSNTYRNENEHNNTKEFSEELKEVKTITAIEVPGEKKNNTEGTNIKPEENSSLEDRLKILEEENAEFKQSLLHLSSCVKKLEERVRNLEDGSLSSSMTDEGVDMTGEPRCPFFEDCLCNSDSDETKPNGDNISLNDGSEFEEFVATTTIDNCETCRDTLWKDDWEDSTGRDLAAELRENCRN